MRTLTFAAAFLLAGITNAQWGIRYIAPQAESVTKKGPFGLFLVGLGADFDYTDRTSCGIDLLFDTNWDPYGKDQQVTNPTYPTGSSYQEKLKVYGAQFRSQYHFGSTDGTALYMGPTIGLRYVRQTLEGELISNTGFGNYNSTSVTETANAIIFPVGLRLGVRGGLDGGYADLYVGVGTALGGDQPLNQGVFVSEDSELSTFNLQVGFAFGFGSN